MTSPRSRDVFPLRFKNYTTRTALKHLSEQTGMSMTDIAERAIEHEVVLQGADVERRLEEALAIVRGYEPPRDAAAYIDAAAAGEGSGLEPFRGVRADHETTREEQSRLSVGSDPYGVLAAFSRG